MNIKSKVRATNRQKVKVDSYDADLSMDSLNSIVPLRTDKNGRIVIGEGKYEEYNKTRLDNDLINEADSITESQNDHSNVWCGKEILSKLSTLKNVSGTCVYQIMSSNISSNSNAIVLGSSDETDRMEFREMPGLSCRIGNLLTMAKESRFLCIFSFVPFDFGRK